MWFVSTAIKALCSGCSGLFAHLFARQSKANSLQSSWRAGMYVLRFNKLQEGDLARLLWFVCYILFLARTVYCLSVQSARWSKVFPLKGIKLEFQWTRISESLDVRLLRPRGRWRQWNLLSCFQPLQASMCLSLMSERVITFVSWPRHISAITNNDFGMPAK